MKEKVADGAKMLVQRELLCCSKAAHPAPLDEGLIWQGNAKERKSTSQVKATFFFETADSAASANLQAASPFGNVTSSTLQPEHPKPPAAGQLAQEHVHPTPSRRCGTDTQSRGRAQPKARCHTKHVQTSPAARSFTRASPIQLQPKTAKAATVGQVARGSHSRTNSISQSGAHTLKLHIVTRQQVGTAVSFSVKKITIALQAPTIGPLNAEELYKQQFHIPVGWGSVAGTLLYLQEEQLAALNQAELEQEFHRCPTSHCQYAIGAKAYWDLLMSMQSWKQGWFVLPFHAALECTNDAVWSQAREILLLRRRERLGSRLVTQPKRELYGARRTLYPYHCCRQLQITSSCHLNPESRYSGKQGLAVECNLKLHSECLSSRKFQRGLALLAACKMLKKTRNLFLKKAERAMGKTPPEHKTPPSTTTLEATARPYKTVCISRKTKTLQAKSSLLLAEKDGQKYTDLATSQNFLASAMQTFSPLLISPGQGLDVFVLHKFSSFLLTLPQKKAMSVGITSGEKPACQEESISNFEAIDVENSAVHYSSHTGVQDNAMYKTEPQESVLVFFQVEIDKFMNSFCLSVPLALPRRSPFAEVGRSEGTSEIAQQLLQGADQPTESYDMRQEEVSSEANVVKVDRELAHTDSSLTPSPSKWEYGTNNFLKSTTLNEDAVESAEKGSSDITVARSIKHLFPSSSAPNDIAPPVRKTAPKNVVAPAMPDCAQREKSPVEQAPSNGTEASCNKELPKEQKWTTNLEPASKHEVQSSSEKRKSANEAASNKQDSRPTDISARKDMLPNFTPKVFEKATYPNAENSSSKTLTHDRTKVEMPGNVQLSGRKTSSKKAVLLLQKEEPLYEEMPYSWKTVWKGKKCPDITATDKQELAPQKQVKSYLSKLEPAVEAAGAKEEPTAIVKSMGTSILQSLARQAPENAGVISKRRAIPEYFTRDYCPDMEVTLKCDNSAQRATPQNCVPTSKPKWEQNEESLSHATSSAGEVCGGEEIASKMGSPFVSPVATNFTKTVTLNAEPGRSQQRKPDLGQDPKDTSRTWQSPTADSAAEPFSLREKSTLPSRSEETVPDLRRSLSHLWFSSVHHPDGSSEVSPIPDIHIVEIGSAHDSGNEHTSLEALSSLLNQIEQRQKGTSILRDTSHEPVITAAANNADWKSAENEQSRISEAMSTLTAPVRSPGRTFRDVLQGIGRTEPDKSGTTAMTCAQPHQTCHPEGRKAIGSTAVQLDQNDPTPEYLAVGTKPLHMSKKAERINIGSREWIELLKRKVMGPEYRERQPLSIDVLQESAESRGGYLKPEIVVVEFKSAPSGLSQQQEKHSEATHCQERPGSPQDFKSSPACGNTPLRAADAGTAVRKISPVARTSLCTEGQPSAALRQEEQNFRNYKASKLECDIPRQSPVPEEVPSVLPNSTCGNVARDTGTDGATSQSSGCYTLWDIEPWLSELHGNRHSPPLSISYATNMKSYDNEGTFLQYFTNDNFSEVGPAERDALNCQSPCSHADGPLFFGQTEPEMCSTETAISDTNATTVPPTDSRDCETVQDDLCIASKNALHEGGTMRRSISVSERRKLPKVTRFRNLKKLFGLARFDNTSQ